MLTCAHPSFSIVKSGSDQRLLISVCIHGNETCGLLAFNELLQASLNLSCKEPLSVGLELSSGRRAC